MHRQFTAAVQDLHVKDVYSLSFAALPHLGVSVFPANSETRQSFQGYRVV
jgi:hypothetical protein